MLVIPRLDIAGGVCIKTGVAAAGANDPLTAARVWAAEGFSRLLIVDRDALAGRGSNLSQIEFIARDAGVELDVSAASDSSEQIETLIDAGAVRVVLGPRALAETDWLESVATMFPSALTVETSVRERRVVTRGWVRTLPVDLLELADGLAGVPLAGLLIVALDGASGGGLELALLEDVASACEFPVLVEDARPTVASLRALEHRGLAGVIVPAGVLATSLEPRALANEFGR